MSGTRDIDAALAGSPEMRVKTGLFVDPLHTLIIELRAELRLMQRAIGAIEETASNATNNNAFKRLLATRLTRLYNNMAVFKYSGSGLSAEQLSDLTAYAKHVRIMVSAEPLSKEYDESQLEFVRLTSKFQDGAHQKSHRFYNIYFAGVFLGAALAFAGVAAVAMLGGPALAGIAALIGGAFLTIYLLDRYMLTSAKNIEKVSKIGMYGGQLTASLQQSHQATIATVSPSDKRRCCLRYGEHSTRSLYLI